eukprot:sb/3479318/
MRLFSPLSLGFPLNQNLSGRACQGLTPTQHFLKWQQCMKCTPRLTLTLLEPNRKGKFHVFLGWFKLIAASAQTETLKSGCLSLLTIHRFWHSRRVRAVVRVWLGFGLGVSVSAIDSLSDAVFTQIGHVVAWLPFEKSWSIKKCTVFASVHLTEISQNPREGYFSAGWQGA